MFLVFVQTGPTGMEVENNDGKTVHKQTAMPDTVWLE